MSENINIGIIGAGKIVQTAHLPILASFDNVGIKYIADVTDVKELARRYKARGIKIGENLSALPDCDIVLIATPVNVRASYLQEFGKRGIPIFAEKPFARNLETHRMYLEMANTVVCNYMRMYYSSIRQMREIVSSEMFGKLRKVVIYQYNSLRRTGKPKNHYQMDPALSGGGILIEKGCHPLSQLTFILDNWNIEVLEASGVWLHGLDFHIEAAFDATSDGNRVEVEFVITYLSPGKTCSRYLFDTAEILFDHDTPNPLCIKPPNANRDGAGKGFWITPDKKWAMTQPQAFYLRWKDFMDKVIEEEPLDTAFETSIKTTALITGVYEKAEREER